MKLSLKIMSLLLSYPTLEIQKALSEVVEPLNEDQTIKTADKVALIKLIDDLSTRDIYDAQERYTLLFDRTRTLSLHLFEHVHGESRDRGQAMVDLLALYENSGLEVSSKELPDYLPLFLEYLSTRSNSEAEELLGETVHIIVALKERLKKRKSIYVNVFAVLENIAVVKPDSKLLEELLATPEDDPDDLEALDRVWEEEVVSFGGNAGEGVCGTDRLRTQMRAADRKPVDTPQPQTGMEG